MWGRTRRMMYTGARDRAGRFGIPSKLQLGKGVGTEGKLKEL